MPGCNLRCPYCYNAELAFASPAAGAAVAWSAGILAKAAAEGLLAVEYRTVLVPGLVDEGDIMEIAHLLPKDAAWRFAAFMPGNCLNPAWNKKEPYSQAQMQRMVEAARENASRMNKNATLAKLPRSLTTAASRNSLRQYARLYTRARTGTCAGTT